jgi:hypothetical protein
MREVLAAWICCGVVGLGAALLGGVDNRGDSLPAPYSGTHIPGRGAAIANALSVEDEFADAGTKPADDLDGNIVEGGARWPQLLAEAPRCWARMRRRLM